MSLREYRRKRNFERTPEPAAAGSQENRRRFVVQRHDARKLHYDLRLEAGGVLKSWAVPKGPSLNPRDKRLAVMTEDHPVKYLKFEGYIPEGSYGAGQMDIWDAGTYEPEEGVDVEEAIRKGRLKFTLSGKRLRGGFSLVRIKGEDQQQWLLIKQKDDFATDEPYDIESISGGAPEKVKPAPVPAPAAEEEEGVALIPPMLARLAEGAPFDHPDWIFEPKLDGYRAIASIANGKASLYSRRGNSYNDAYPDIVRSLSHLQFEAVLDGEIVVLDEEEMARFNLLQRYKSEGKGQILYSVFDLLYLDGRSLLSLPLTERKEELKRILINLPGIRYCEHVRQEGKAYFRRALSEGYEGMIGKKATSLYMPGVRTEDWLKFKAKKGQEAIICGYTRAKDSRPIGALLLGIYEEAKLRFVGHCGTGFDLAEQERLYKLFQPLVRKTSPFPRRVKANAPVTWLRPELICEVEFQEWTPDGLMRHSAYKGLRDDKLPEAITREEGVTIEEQQHEPAPPRTAPASASDVGIEGDALVIDGVRVELTNLDKVFWPEEGYTKFDLLQYYIQVSDRILPYLIDRPQSLHRHPDGVRDEGFYQKDVAGELPAWIETEPVWSESKQKNITYLLCQRTATLLYLVNLGCIEINPWNSRVGHLEYPDYCIIDLDPGDRTRFEDVIEVAQVVRDVLGKAGINGLCKTSGSRGMHICIPLGARYTYEQSRDFAKALSMMVQRRLPRLTSLKRNPKERREQVYLDYLQNKEGATLAAPYCVRPRPGATVSAPLEWDEVKPGLHPDQFTIRTMPARLSRMGDLWRELLGEGIDMLDVLDRLAE